MRTCSIVLLLLVVSPAWAQEALPAGWQVAMSPKSAYAADTGTLSEMPGRTLAVLRAIAPVGPAGSGARMSHVVTAVSYRGKRLRVTTRLKTVEAGVSRCYLAVLQDGLVLQGANVPITAGSHDWTPCSVVLDVPVNATGLRVGINLNGGGAVWSDGFHFEPVTKDVPLTPTRTPWERPVNLGFDP